MTKKAAILLTVSFYFISSCFSQEPPTSFLKGIIVNASTGESIPYATIQVSENGINTMSNENGLFIFKIPVIYNKEKILITHVGFKPQAIIFNMADSGARVIKLQEAVIGLQEVVVKKMDPLELIKNAIAKIPENYPVTPYRVSGFYRMTGLKEKRVIDLSEAVFDIYYENYSGKNSQFKLIKSRVDKDLTAFNGSDNINMGLDPSAVVSIDMLSDIKGSDLLSEKGLASHVFSFKGIVHYNGQQAYEILFDEKDGIKKSLFKGKMLLNVDDLAFLEFDFRLSPKGVKYFDWGFFMKLMLSMAHVKADVLSDNKIITYRKYGGKYYLNHANNTGQIYLAGGNRHFVLDPLATKINFLVTSIDTSDVKPFQKDEILRNKLSIESRSKTINDTKDSPDRSDTTDPFWENYNLIQAEYNVDSAVRVIQANNATLNFKEQMAKYLRKNGKDRVKGIDSVISFYHQKNQFNGTALIQNEGKVMYEKGFGLANKELNIANTGQTQFRIGSTSKQFTSMLIMQLVNENKLSVSDTIGKYLPGYIHGNISIQQLLTHQSGIPNYTASPDYYVKIVSKKYTPEELVNQFCSDSLEFPAGTQFNYSNSGYVILADIIEKVTGKIYADVLAERIFIPLGMKNSFFVSGSQMQNLAKGYMNGQPENAYPVDNVIGAGGITSTAEDLLIWANALTLNRLLPKSEMDEIFKPRVEWKEWDADYGYGWMIDRNVFRVSKKHIVQYHPGTEFGFFDMLVIQQGKGIVVILLNNTGDFPRFDMTDLILNELDK
jgi:CubicO group peptidase (beta-lactamase class C family)